MLKAITPRFALFFLLNGDDSAITDSFSANILIIPFNNRFKLVYMIHNIVVGVVA